MASLFKMLAVAALLFAGSAFAQNFAGSLGAAQSARDALTAAPSVETAQAAAEAAEIARAAATTTAEIAEVNALIADINAAIARAGLNVTTTAATTTAAAAAGSTVTWGVGTSIAALIGAAGVYQLAEDQRSP